MDSIQVDDPCDSKSEVRTIIVSLETASRYMNNITTGIGSHGIFHRVIPPSDSNDEHCRPGLWSGQYGAWNSNGKS